MGWDPDFYLDHSLKFKNAEDLLEVFSSIVGEPVFVQCYSGSTGEQDILAPEDFKGWRTHYDRDESLDVELEKNTLQLYKPIPLDEELWISRKSFMLSSDEVDTGRWNYTIRLIEELSKCTSDQLRHHPFQETRKAIYKWAKLLGSKWYVIFCGDSNQDVESDLWNHHSIEEVLEIYKDRWIIVEYSTIHEFKFDEEMYSHLIFIDRFEGLQ